MVTRAPHDRGGKDFGGGGGAKLGQRVSYLLMRV
jgi:hypothetical protein